ncbi:hypothetical protein GC087_24260 (plasmid) [Pantoea sp. JZ2]|nr:hypothetical protein GC087_24260 [Pantoea sp. JZ2]
MVRFTGMLTLQRSPNIQVIAGTSLVAHLRENLAAANLSLSTDQVRRLNEMRGT